MSIEMAASQVRAGARFGVRLHQLIATQVAAVLLLLGALQGGAALLAAVASAAGLLAVTWVRARGRWAFRWLGTLVDFAARERAVQIDGPAAVLGFTAPRTLVTTADLAGAPAAVLVDELGLTLLFEVGDPSADVPPLPPLATLLPPPEKDQPPARIQLVTTAASAPAARNGAGPAATSYRALCEGRSLGHHSAVLAVRVMRAGGWTEEELRRGLLGLGRRLTRRLANLPARPLDRAAALRVIAEFAHGGEPGDARETWSGIRLGGLTQTTFRCRPAPGGVLPAHLVARLLHLPAAATTVAVTAEPHSGRVTSLMVRLAATDTAGLDTAVQGLRRSLAAEGIGVRRWDGAHLPGLTATLPLGGDVAIEDSVDAPALPAVPAGLMVGRNRQGDAVQARLFRPEATLVLLVGSLAATQVLAFRAMAAGARVVVHSKRPQAWEPFAHGAAAPGESITVRPPNQLLGIPAGSPLRPTLTIVDSGDTATPPTTATAGRWQTSSATAGRWQTTLVVRDTLRAGDLETATQADLLLLQALDQAEAALLDGALQLGQTATYLTRMRPDMIALVSRRTVRWAALAQTQIEASLIGEVKRAAVRV